jgi:RimJ/RimL family protein N-acetyltransferase
MSTLKHIRFKLINLNHTYEVALLLSWRSNPDNFRWFKVQNSTIEWEEHIFFLSNRKNRRDYFIMLNNRPVGHIAISNMNHEYPHLSIMIGESGLKGKGLGHLILVKFITKLRNERFKKFKALINQSNIASIRLFEKVGFKKSASADSWLTYYLELE